MTAEHPWEEIVAAPPPMLLLPGLSVEAQAWPRLRWSCSCGNFHIPAFTGWASLHTVSALDRPLFFRTCTARTSICLLCSNTHMRSLRVESGFRCTFDVPWEGHVVARQVTRQPIVGVSVAGSPPASPPPGHPCAASSLLSLSSSPLSSPLRASVAMLQGVEQFSSLLSPR